MKNILYQKQWHWTVSGLALGLSFLLAVALVKPIGVSTQFVIFDGIVWDLFSSEVAVKDATSTGAYSSSNEYLNKSGGKYAENIANPINYGFIFVLAMIAGGFLGSKLQSKSAAKDEDELPEVWCANFGRSKTKRYLMTFTGGALVLFGSRLAGGCTSGHMMSGIMQTSLSGYLFTIGAFLLAVPIALFMYRKGN
ncbi:MAG: YeeE/YedE thiosulfate transporter family protein [Cycloclasticus sp.]|nr:YeeE/YedE thiosulfate transporter family protein [Cycloclasticus sp.]